MGRRARPVELHRLKGNHLAKATVASRLEAEDSLRPQGSLEPPAWLDDAALAEWHRVVQVMEATGVITAADTQTLAVYCDAVARYAEAARLVQAQGVVINTSKGPAQNPAVLVADKYHKILARAAAALGLDPSSRALLALKNTENTNRKDDFAELFG